MEAHFVELLNGSVISREMNVRGQLTEPKIVKFIKDTIKNDRELKLHCCFGRVDVNFEQDGTLYAKSELNCNAFAGHTDCVTTIYKLPNKLAV